MMKTILRRSEMASLKSTLIIGTAFVALSACAKQRTEIPPAPIGTVGDTSSGTSNAGSVVPGSQEDFVASVAADRVYFDTDRFDIDSEDQATLRSQAQWLAKYSAVRVTIEGHCDERGTRDYNLALGERRANSAKNYLASLGVDAARISTISYGKERPDAVGSDEASWARNRRAVSVTVR
jgi:peptidoglycan-associated lipoprotein